MYQMSKNAINKYKKKFQVIQLARSQRKYTCFNKEHECK